MERRAMEREKGKGQVEMGMENRERREM